MTLDRVPPGKVVKVLAIGGGRGLRQRLLRLGIQPGEEIKVLRSAPLSGPLMVEGKGGVFVIGRGMASRVLVEEVE